MKKHINKFMFKTIIIVVLIGVLVSCSDKKQQKKAQDQARLDSLSLPENVTTVSAIAKVEPALGLIELSSSVGGNIIAIKKSEGEG